jgi:hypothetical protein
LRRVASIFGRSQHSQRGTVRDGRISFDEACKGLSISGFCRPDQRVEFPHGSDPRYLHITQTGRVVLFVAASSLPEIFTRITRSIPLSSG